MRKAIVKIIELYQKIPAKSHSSCVFIPTCSEYTKEAVIKYGTILGVTKGIIRICRCYPWQKQKYDPLR